MNVRMVLEVLSPCVQNTEESDVGAEVLRIAGDLDHRSSAGSEEQVVEQPLVLKHK
jgi:hypothetical protein